jgi:hypothetical protein
MVLLLEILERCKINSKWRGLAADDTVDDQISRSADPHGASLTIKESNSRPDRPSLKPGSPIPDVSLTDLKGKPHAFRHNTADFSLSSNSDTHCGPCPEEMPKLKALYDKLPRPHLDVSSP